MKQFACGDVVPGCDATFVGADDADVLTSVSHHAAEAHGLTDLSPELVAAVRSHLVTV